MWTRMDVKCRYVRKFRSSWASAEFHFSWSPTLESLSWPFVICFEEWRLGHLAGESASLGLCLSLRMICFWGLQSGKLRRFFSLFYASKMCLYIIKNVCLFLLSELILYSYFWESDKFLEPNGRFKFKVHCVVRDGFVCPSQSRTSRLRACVYPSAYLK